MQKKPGLLPTPRKVKLAEGLCNLSNNSHIYLVAQEPQSLLFTASQIQAALEENYKFKLEIYAGKVTQLGRPGISLRLDPHVNIKRQGYRLKITPDEILLEARDEPGLFYASCTLIQLLEYYSLNREINNIVPFGHLPCIEIHDWPDFTNRGVMLDISRNKVPTMETLFSLVELLSSWKINQLQLYTEHTFAYLQHPDVWANASPFTGEEILKLDAYCRNRYIELVPNQNSFGHLEHWLKLSRYKPLAEAPDGFNFPWGRQEGPFSLCPLDEGSISLLKSLYDELLPHFSSRQFNVCCDETFDVGQGRSKAECERVGVGRVYLDFLLKIHQEVTQRGFQMQFWGDIIMAHPELVSELPIDSIALEWGYEANHPFKEHGEKFAQAGLPFYVCPGTSAWNSIAGRTDNCLANLANAAQNGINNGADGYLITDWGDNGHWQVLPVSYLGFAVGAAYAWSFQSNKDLDIREALNLYAFRDSTGTMGSLAYDLGNIYHEVGIEPDNASALFHILQNPIQDWVEYLDRGSAIQVLHHTLGVIDQLYKQQSGFSSMRPDKELLQREFTLSVDLLRHACMRGIFGFGSPEFSKNTLTEDIDRIKSEFEQIWLSRNRPGGLPDSLSYFDKTKMAYQQQ
jgi:hypothetical protein